MDATDWKCELNRLLELFHRESEISLRKISQCFVTLERPFDENFRKYFLRVSSLRLDTSFNTILMEQFYENQTQTASNSNEIVRNANISSSNYVRRMDGPNNGNSPGLKIEIADSDDESGELDYPEMQMAKDSNGDQKELNTVQRPNDDDNLTQEQNESTSVDGNGNGIEVYVKPKIEIEPEAAEMDLELVEFNPNANNDRSTIEHGATTVAESNQASDQNQARSSAAVRKPLNGEHPDKRFKCSDCAYAFKFKAYLKRHQQIHVQQKLLGIVQDPNDGLFKCTHCDQRFVKWYSFSKHLKFTHKNNQRLFNCMHCLRSFTQRTERERHEIQCQIRRYECYVCKIYVTRYVSQMQSHMRTHSCLKPFQCAVCNKTYRHKSNLKYHLYHSHSMSKNYVQLHFAEMNFPFLNK